MIQPTPPLHVVVGTGALGRAVIDAAQAAGHRVRVLSRTGQVRGLPDTVEILAGDGADADSVARASQDAVAVHHCAAPPYTDWATAHPPLMRGLIQGCGRTGALLVNSSNVYPYGKVDAPVSEDTPIRPVSRKGAIRAEIDELAREADRSGTAHTVTLRSPDFYGPGASATTVYGDRVFGRIVAGRRPQVFGRLDVLHSWVLVTDFGRAMVALATAPETWGRVWHLPSPPPATQSAMIDLIATAAGTKARPQAAPTWALRTIGRFSPIVGELAEMAYQWEEPYVVAHEAFDAHFPGWVATPHQDGIASTLDWFRSRA
jgi:nucleoside-diphosphate-sugar epimerase